MTIFAQTKAPMERIIPGNTANFTAGLPAHFATKVSPAVHNLLVNEQWLCRSQPVALQNLCMQSCTIPWGRGWCSLPIAAKFCRKFQAICFSLLLCVRLLAREGKANLKTFGRQLLLDGPSDPLPLE